VGQWRASADIPATVRGPSAARHMVGALMRGWELGGLCDDAELVVSELVTNAVVHAPGTDSFELELTRHPDHVTISLADGSAIRPVIEALDADRPRGRGMLIVSSLAADWGSEEQAGGKRVWVDLAVDDAR
jgi:anti-sigma regulatory factor (Ser/Thr protein kinase)